MKEGHYMKYNQTYANLLSRTVEAYISTFYYKGYRIEVYQLDFNRKIYRVCKSYRRCFKSGWRCYHRCF